LELSFTRELEVPVRDPSLAVVRIDKYLTLNVGDPAPDFTGTTTDGKELRLADLRGKVVLLDFWATWCAPCIAEFPNLLRVYDQYAAKGTLVVIGISLDQDSQTVQKFVHDRKLPWPQIVLGPAETNSVAKAYNVSGVPATFLIGPDGKIIAKGVTGEALRAAISRVFPTVAQAKSE